MYWDLCFWLGSSYRCILRSSSSNTFWRHYVHTFKKKKKKAAVNLRLPPSLFRLWFIYNWLTRPCSCLSSSMLRQSLVITVFFRSEALKKALFFSCENLIQCSSKCSTASYLQSNKQFGCLNLIFQNHNLSLHSLRLTGILALSTICVLALGSLRLR